MFDTAKVYETIVEAFNAVIPAFFEDADMPNDPIYCVFNSPKHSDIADNNGDLIFFYIDLFGDDRTANNSVLLQQACDDLRNALTGAIISAEGYFAGHLNFEQNISLQESEFDINHRRQEWTARVFYR